MTHVASAVLLLHLLPVLSSAHESRPARPFTIGVAAGEHPAGPQAKPADGARAFDFLIGEWTVRHRRRTAILKGTDNWTEFSGTLVARSIWNGRGHIDEFRGDSPSGAIEGMSLRLYDPSSNQWRDYYSNATKRVFDPPIVGTFTNGRLEFFSHELFEGRGIYVRQLWTVLTPASCRWEQAFSADGGQTWETNWVMDLTRVPAK